jgi:hypothetical protein
MLLDAVPEVARVRKVFPVEFVLFYLKSQKMND